MIFKKQNKHRAALCLAVIVLLAMVVPTIAQAASSAQLRQELDDLESQQADIQSQMESLQAEQDANWESIEEMVAYKNNIDSQIFLLYSEIDNITKQIAGYRTLIAQTQQELDAAQAELDALNEKYKARIRAMEEEGEVTYWMVIFKATSFTDLIDRLNMIDEIAQADQKMLAELSAAAQTVADYKAELESEKTALEESLARQQEAQVQMQTMREEADAVLAALNSDRMDMEALHQAYADEKAALSEEIAKAEMEYTAALRAEEEARREEEEANRKPEPSKPEEDEEEPEEKPEPRPPSSDNGWRQPCSYIMITSGYGQRSSGWHNGVDFANNRGTPIYASRSGTVTTVKSLNYSYGNYVVINHGDGFSSLYAHMDYYIVSQGQYVNQGELIGYMGSTGNSSGNHLHFTIFYNGSDVNPMDYL